MGADGVISADDRDVGDRPVAIVVASGARLPAAVRAALPANADVVAAEGGVDAALALGLAVDLAIGDFDSVTDEGLARAVAAGALVERYPVDKDATDLELAIDAAVARGARDVVVLASGGGRFDHLLAATGVLTRPSLAGVRVRAWFGDSCLVVITPDAPAVLHGELGDLVTLLACNGAALGVRTDGLAYPLDGEDLLAGSSRGVSNVLSAPVAHVTITGGTLLAVLPGHPPTDWTST
ncbi:MAG: thiamine diphosphokinase [Acidimicrobiales bacterium]